jgi:hypothetical protein
MTKSLVVEVVTEGDIAQDFGKRTLKNYRFGRCPCSFHDPVAIDLFFQIAKTVKPSAVIVAGDFVDFYAISRFVRTPERRLLACRRNKDKQGNCYMLYPKPSESRENFPVRQSRTQAQNFPLHESA